MPEAKLHWSYDLLAAALVGGISGLVFWLVPPAEAAAPIAAQHVSAAMVSTSIKAPTCNAVTS